MASTITFEAGSTTTVTNFTPSGTAGNLVTVDTSVFYPNLEYLVVAGGGGGGAGNASFYGGGGGGGGQVVYTNLSGFNQGTTVTVTVGAGGTNGLANGTNGTNGATSSITIGSTISALPGQYGKNFATPGNPWGGTSGSGNAGGVGYANNGQGSSGGGDATVGFDYNASPAAGGGWGTLVSAFDMYGTNNSNSTLPSSGKGYFGGGGAGGQWPAMGQSVGGRGGGGDSPGNVAAQAGLPGLQNTGGGGGGGGAGYNYTGVAAPGGAGGSGIVIIRFPDSYPAATTTGSPTITVAGGYRVYVWTSSGSITFTGSAGQATLSKSSGTVSVNYLSIGNSIATGGATWYAGANSVDVGNNTGWIFTAPPPSTNTGNFFLFF